MEAANIFETSTNFYQTTMRNNPENSYLHNREKRTVGCTSLRSAEGHGSHAIQKTVPSSAVKGKLRLITNWATISGSASL
jgi:hypothetical protein